MPPSWVTYHPALNRWVQQEVTQTAAPVRTLSNTYGGRPPNPLLLSVFGARAAHDCAKNAGASTSAEGMRRCALSRRCLHSQGLLLPDEMVGRYDLNT